MAEPLISVVMGVYNGAQFLAPCVESILGQSFGDIEFIVVNDGSSDATAEIMDEYARKDSRIKLTHQQNHGLTDSLNRGAAMACGVYIARMDADDIATKDRFALQLDAMEKRPELAALGGAVDIIDADGATIKQLKFPNSPHDARDLLLSGTSPLCHPSVMMRTEAFRRVGGYRKAFVDAEDYDLWLRLADKFELSNLDDVILKYRRHKGQVSVQKFRQQSLSALAARKGAARRAAGEANPLDLVGRVTPDFLASLGVSSREQHAAIVRGYLTCIRSMSDAGEAETARSMIDSMLASPEWADATPSQIGDFELLNALIHWRSRAYQQSVAACARAMRARPAMIGRPIKPLLRRLGIVAG